MSGWPLAVAAVGVVCLLAGWLVGRTEGDSVAWWEVSEAERLLAEEKDRADLMATWLQFAAWGIVDHSDADAITCLLSRHDAARAAEVGR